MQRNIAAYVDPKIHDGLFKSNQRDKTMILSNFFRFLRQWRAYDNSLRELSRLGDRELADIGLNRSEIARVAWENAERTA